MIVLSITSEIGKYSVEIVAMNSNKPVMAVRTSGNSAQFSSTVVKFSCENTSIFLTSLDYSIIYVKIRSFNTKDEVAPDALIIDGGLKTEQSTYVSILTVHGYIKTNNLVYT